ncbi:hypothetical protein HG536_0E01550 [Torulaspora globosa]|uniref:Uncharacterized protein n=1 Tax=Torulaspora globosa TaxID=48254 RepID=A0A7G3ZIA8_9SACH|nr:uncharacterized protein HG536_0E01550 [Torulaspora globosa]QLL33244.1 hypothetical protein HG536_0E01550 [Torulaspora globosa]
MDSDLDFVIDSIVRSNTETPQLLLKSWLDQFYSISATRGLSSPQLIKMIIFICNSPTLAMTTRLYIAERCLLPNDFISQELIDVVISQLGTATAISDSRSQVPEKIQVSLCRWLVHVFFLVTARDETNALQPSGSIWLHLWQFDYLQHWLTYIVLWTTTSPKDIKRWKVILLGRVGSKPNYRDSQACSTLLLRRFESVGGKSELITRTIADLRCNQRRLKSLQSFQYDKEFITKLRSILLNSSYSNFTDDILNELMTSSLDQLKCLAINEGSRISSLDTSAEGVPLLNTQSLSKLASQWDCIVEPLNAERFLGNVRTSPCHFYLLSLTDEHKFWTIACKWLTIQLGMFFKNPGDMTGVQNIIKICQIYGSLTSFIIREFFSAEYLNANPEGFLLLFDGLFSLPVSFSINQHTFARDAMQVVAISFLNKKMKQTIFPSIANAIVMFLRHSRFGDGKDWAASFSDLIQSIHELLVSTLTNIIENRLTTITLVSTLKSILALQHHSGKYKLKYVIAPPNIIRRQFISDDPLLLDACCYYLVRTKDFLLDENPSNRYVQFQNNYILDLTNYLWRNKMVETKSFAGIPSEFLRAVIDNLYLSDVAMKAKAPFSITGVPALSYAFIAKLRDLQPVHDARIRYFGPLSDESFRALKRSEKFARWLEGVLSLKELKIEVLKAFDETGPYNNVAAFLFTYLKSLSQYSRVI